LKTSWPPLAYTTYACNPLNWYLFVTSLYTWQFGLLGCSYCDLFLSNVKWAAVVAIFELGFLNW